MHREGRDDMRNRGRWVVALLVTMGLALPACAPAAESEVAQDAPAVIGKADANGVKSVKLTRQAFDRLGIEMVAIRESRAATPSPSNRPSPSSQPTRGAAQSGPRKVVPYSAVLYDPTGVTWVYTTPRPLMYLRQRVEVATVGGANGTEAILSQGPPAGTMIVSTGVIELYGAELGVGK